MPSATSAACPASEGRTYQLADPHPLTVEEMTDTLARATGRELIKVPLPRTVAKGALARVPGVYGLMRIPPEAVDYFAHPTLLPDRPRPGRPGRAAGSRRRRSQLRRPARRVRPQSPGGRLGGDGLSPLGCGLALAPRAGLCGADCLLNRRGNDWVAGATRRRTREHAPGVVGGLCALASAVRHTTRSWEITRNMRLLQYVCRLGRGAGGGRGCGAAGA